MMISPIRNLILALSLFIPLGGEEEQAAPTAPPPAALVGTNWNLVSMTVEAKVAPLRENHGMTLAIGEDGRISGYGGVNRFFASLQEKNGTLVWSPIGSTRRGGPPGSHDR
jgi:heat shock protein HslJ